MDKKKIKVGVMTTYMDRRPAKGTAIIIRGTVQELLNFRDEFDITLIHREPIPEDHIYKKFNEIILPKVTLPHGGGFLSELLFYLKAWFREDYCFDIMYYPYSSIHPFFWLSPFPKIIFTAMDGGPATAGFSVKKYGKPTLIPKFFSWRIDAFIAISEFGRRGIIDTYDVSPEKVHVVYDGLHPGFVPIADKSLAQKELKNKYGILSPYILDVSRFDPHKNILRLIKAYHSLITEYGVKDSLVFVGGRHIPDYSAQVDSLIDKLNLRNRVFIAPFVEDEDMLKVYNGAEFLVFPSLYEGFGLPVIEAMGCGIPVLISNLDVLKEISGSHAEIVDPYDTESIRKGILTLLNNQNLREKLSKEGINWVKRFSWQSHISSLVSVFREVYSKHKKYYGVFS